jgi:hypothetical protein
MGLRIIYPRPNATVVTPRGLFVCWGRADSTLTQLCGQCEAAGHPDQTVKGSAHYYLDPQTGAFYRWVLAFNLSSLAAHGPYTLTVSGRTTQNPLASVTRTFNTSTTVKKGSIEVPEDAGAISIVWPTAGEDISDYADDFVPYGTLSGAQLGSVTLTDVDFPANSPTPIYTFGDPITLLYWCAQFPILTDPLYNLDVTDAPDDASDSADGLKID